MNTFNFNDDYQLDFTLNTCCFLQQIQNNITTNDDMKSYVLYEYLQNWQKEIELSKLFDDEELTGILPIWFEYFIKILNCVNKKFDLQQFLHFAKSDIQKKSFNYIDEQWECIRAFICEENEEEFMPENSEYDGTTGTDEDSDIETNDDRIRAAFKDKCSFMLNITVPNNFQYTLFKMLFKTTDNRVYGPTHIFYPESMQFVNKVCCEKSSGKTKKIPIQENQGFQLEPLATAKDLGPAFYDDPVLYLNKLKLIKECIRRGMQNDYNM